MYDVAKELMRDAFMDGAYSIIVVDPGTVIKDEASNREEVVTDGSVVVKGSRLYCTPIMERGLKRAISNQ